MPQLLSQLLPSLVHHFSVAQKATSSVSWAQGSQLSPRHPLRGVSAEMFSSARTLERGSRQGPDGAWNGWEGAGWGGGEEGTQGNPEQAELERVRTSRPQFWMVFVNPGCLSCRDGSLKWQLDPEFQSMVASFIEPNYRLNPAKHFTYLVLFTSYKNTSQVGVVPVPASPDEGTEERRGRALAQVRGAAGRARSQAPSLCCGMWCLPEVASPPQPYPGMQRGALSLILISVDLISRRELSQSH